jgi:hypothetical protein
MIGEKFNGGTLISRLLWTMPNICKVSDGTREVGLWNFLIPFLWGRLYMGMEKYTPNRARFFVRKKYTTFSTEQIV